MKFFGADANKTLLACGSNRKYSVADQQKKKHVSHATQSDLTPVTRAKDLLNKVTQKTTRCKRLISIQPKFRKLAKKYASGTRRQQRDEQITLKRWNAQPIYETVDEVIHPCMQQQWLWRCLFFFLFSLLFFTRLCYNALCKLTYVVLTCFFLHFIFSHFPIPSCAPSHTPSCTPSASSSICSCLFFVLILHHWCCCRCVRILLFLEWVPSCLPFPLQQARLPPSRWISCTLWCRGQVGTLLYGKVLPVLSIPCFHILYYNCDNTKTIHVYEENLDTIG